MKRLKMIWWLLTKKDVCMIARGNCCKNEYLYDSTTTVKDTVTMSARLCQYNYSSLYRKEMSLYHIFNVHIPEEND